MIEDILAGYAAGTLITAGAFALAYRMERKNQEEAMRRAYKDHQVEEYDRD